MVKEELFNRLKMILDGEHQDKYGYRWLGLPLRGHAELRLSIDCDPNIAPKSGKVKTSKIRVLYNLVKVLPEKEAMKMPGYTGSEDIDELAYNGNGEKFMRARNFEFESGGDDHVRDVLKVAVLLYEMIRKNTKGWPDRIKYENDIGIRH